MKNIFTYTLWAASVVAVFHFGYSIQNSSGSLVAEIGGLREDIRNTVQDLPEIAEDSSRRASSGAIDEPFVKPVREFGRSIRGGLTDASQSLGLPFKF